MSDHALNALLDVHSRLAEEIDEALLRRCYDIQKQFQYDNNRDVALNHLRRLIEHFVDSEIRDSIEGRPV